MTSEDENEKSRPDQQQLGEIESILFVKKKRILFNTLKRRNSFNQESSQKRENLFPKKGVFDGMSNIPTYTDGYRDGGLFNTLKRRNSFNQESSQKRENLFPKKRVFDGKRNIPTYTDEYRDGVLIVVIDEKYHVDKDDFIAMSEVMQAFFSLRYRGTHDSRNRFITVLDALKEFLTVDEEHGSFKIVKIDLSKMQQQERRGSPEDILNVPAAIGKLGHLQELNLAESDIRRVPTEILLGCKNLKVLNLSWTSNLRKLQDEIVNLSELQELYLQYSSIRSLPDYSIFSKLKKLEILDLSSTRALQPKNQECDSITPIQPCGSYLSRSQSDDSDIRLREGFDQMIIAGSGEEKLTSLRKLNLRYSAILKWSPPQFAVFRKFFIDSPDRLRDLDLSGTKDLTSLPDAIGNVSTLERLNVAFADIDSLPPTTSTFYDRLVRLRVLSLTSTPVLRKYRERMKMANRCAEATTPPLHGLVLGRRCSLLGCIGLQPYQVKSFLAHRKLSEALALNRARSRIVPDANHGTEGARGGVFGGGGGCRFSRALWPILLAKKASFLFRAYEDCNDEGCDCQRPKKQIDALFCLLVAFGNGILVENDSKVSVETCEAAEIDGFVVVGNTNNENEIEREDDDKDDNDWMLLG